MKTDGQIYPIFQLNYVHILNETWNQFRMLRKGKKLKDLRKKRKKQDAGCIL